jgi:hypothetical protein
MKQFAITAFLFIHTAFAFGQIVNDNTTFFNYSYDKTIIKLKKVETITIQMYFSDGKSSGKTIYHFDKEGLLTRQVIQDTTGIPKSEFFFELIITMKIPLEYKKTMSTIELIQ